MWNVKFIYSNTPHDKVVACRLDCPCCYWLTNWTWYGPSHHLWQFKSSLATFIGLTIGRYIFVLLCMSTWKFQNQLCICIPRCPALLLTNWFLDIKEINSYVAYSEGRTLLHCSGHYVHTRKACLTQDPFPYSGSLCTYKKFTSDTGPL